MHDPVKNFKIGYKKIIKTMDIQHEKAYQKCPLRLTVKDKGGKKVSARWHKNIGLGFKTPKEAITSNYVDHKCPFTSNVSIRGNILRGVVISAGKMKRTVVVRRDYLHYIPKYRRYEKRHFNISAHLSPAFPNVKEGDIVTIGECRPLAKTVKYNVIAHQSLSDTAKVRKVFRMF